MLHIKCFPRSQYQDWVWILQLCCVRSCTNICYSFFSYSLRGSSKPEVQLFYIYFLRHLLWGCRQNRVSTWSYSSNWSNSVIIWKRRILRIMKCFVFRFGLPCDGRHRHNLLSVIFEGSLKLTQLLQNRVHPCLLLPSGVLCTLPCLNLKSNIKLPCLSKPSDVIPQKMSFDKLWVLDENNTTNYQVVSNRNGPVLGLSELQTGLILLENNNKTTRGEMKHRAEENRPGTNTGGLFLRKSHHL